MGLRDLKNTFAQLKNTLFTDVIVYDILNKNKRRGNVNMKDTKVIDYNKNHYAVMANMIIKGKQTMSLQEARLIRLLITQIAKNDKDFKTYKVNIQELAEFLEVDSSNLYREIREICQSLMTRTIKIQKGKEWEIFQWLQLAKYDGKGTITLMLSNQIAPYLLQLNAWFTQYQLKNILAMKSFYAIRLYELLKLTVGEDRRKKMEYTFSVQYLREYLECEHKFKQIGQFKDKILDIAVRDISEYSEYNCTYECKKTSRSITDIIFYLELKEQKQEKEEEGAGEKEQEQKELDVDDLVDQLRKIIQEELKTREYRALLRAANNDIELIQEKYELSKKQQNIENLVGWLIKAIENGYTEPVRKQKQGQFNKIEGRKYNYEELERQLLNFERNL